MGVSFFSVGIYQGSTPSLAGVTREVKLYDVDEVPIYTSSDDGKMLTIMSDGSLRWLASDATWMIDGSPVPGAPADPVISVQGRIPSTDAFGCIAGTRFFSTNSVPNYAFEDGDSLFTLLPAKVAFIAANLLNQLITFIPRPKGVQALLKTVCLLACPAMAANPTPTFLTGTGDSASMTHAAPWRSGPGWMVTCGSPSACCSGPNRISPSTSRTTSQSRL